MASDVNDSLEEQEWRLLDRHLTRLVESAPRAGVRQEVLDLAEAPRPPIDLGALEWRDLMPGARYSVWREDPQRHMRGWLIWAKAGSRSPRHRHLGVENLLILQGRLQDHRGVYGPGDICRSATGSEHAEEVPPGEDCICYAVYYGELEPVE